MTDLPAPPFVENTVTTWASSPESPKFVAVGRAACERLDHAANRVGQLRGVDRRRQHVADAGAERLRNRSVDSSGAMRMAPTSGRSPMSFSAAASPSGDEHDGPSTATSGMPVEPLLEQLDAGDRYREVAELHRQPAPHRLVRVDDCDRGAQSPDRTGQGWFVTFGGFVVTEEEAHGCPFGKSRVDGCGSRWVCARSALVLDAGRPVWRELRRILTRQRSPGSCRSGGSGSGV